MTASELIQALLRLDPEVEVLAGHRLLCPVTAVNPVRCGTGEVFIHIDHSTVTKAEIKTSDTMNHQKYNKPWDSTKH